MIELTLVGIIILILIAIALPNFLEARIRAQVTRCHADFATISSALEEYYIEHRVYPPNAFRPAEDGSLPGDKDSKSRYLALRALTSPVHYLHRLPEDPFEGENEANISYDYVNFVDWIGETILTAKVVEHGTGRAAYLLLGRGPDHTLEFTTQKQPPAGIGYSPTNGTRSMGDLMIFGPY